MVRPSRAYPGLIAALLVACAAEPSPRVASGAEHVCALRPGALPRCWGADRFGQLAAGGAAFGPSIDVGAGGASSCAVDPAGAVWCVGFNDHGQLGDGTIEPRDAPVRAVGVPPAVEVSVGYAHTCARTADAEVYCWGWSSIGQAAPGTSGDVGPTRVEGIGRAARVIAGFTHTCALGGDGAAWCWGELFDGDVASVGEDVRAIAIGVDHLCVARPGEVRCFGNEPGGARPALPEEGRGFAVDADVAAGGIDHLCVGGDDGARCLGKNMNGQAGVGQMGGVLDAPAPVRELPGPIEGLAVGDRHSCAASQGAIWCWGWNDVGQLGDDTGVHSLIPLRVPF